MKRSVLRLRCKCGRNLADVTRPRTPDGTLKRSTWTADGLEVSSRNGVEQTRHQHAPGRTDWSYRWACRCGRVHVRRHDRISAAWRSYAPSLQVVVVVLDVDL